MIKTLLFIRIIAIKVFLRWMSEKRVKKERELFELSVLPEKPGQNSSGNFPAALINFIF